MDETAKALALQILTEIAKKERIAIWGQKGGSTSLTREQMITLGIERPSYARNDRRFKEAMVDLSRIEAIAETTLKQLQEAG